MGKKRNRNRRNPNLPAKQTPHNSVEQNAAGSVQIRHQYMAYQGNVPHPAILEAWAQHLPDAAERFMKMAEKEQDRAIDEDRRNHDRVDAQVRNLHNEAMTELKGAAHGRIAFWSIALSFVGIVGLAIWKDRPVGEIVWIIVALALVAAVLVAPQTVEHIAAIFGKNKKDE